MQFVKDKTRDARSGFDAGAARIDKYNRGRAGKAGHQKLDKDVEQVCCDMYPECECPRIK